MPGSSGSETLLVPGDAHARGRASELVDERDGAAQGRGPEYVRKARGTSSLQYGTAGLSTELLNRSAARLRILALLYASIFFMAAYFPALLIPDERVRLFESPVNWVPGVIAIAFALAVAAVIGSARFPVRAVLLFGLVFEIVGSYGIAAAEFLRPEGLEIQGNWLGLSWVAVWTLLFNVVVPTRPRYAVLAALAAVTSVPVTVLTSVSLFPPPFVPSGTQIFFGFFFPYLLVVVMAYVGARVVYSLGAEVTRARELGSYRLVERLGSGGMGEVWRADHRLLARPAAIKLIRSSLSGEAPAGVSDDLRRRFEREAQVIARLRSPHTVNLFDFGVADDGAFYYVMELLEGLDADRTIRRFGSMPSERVIYLLHQICHSLSEAESCGLVHRDIKPANIFLCRYGEDHDFVKVVDFGIVKAAHDGANANTALTVANVIQGTPAYIAPEQALGLDVDGRADIYSTGCVAYWLLTGNLVFTAETPMALLIAHAQATPEPPSVKSELPIPPELDALILSCLAKDRTKRPQSARELSERLAAIKVARPWSEERAREWWQIHLPAGTTNSGSR